MSQNSLPSDPAASAETVPSTPLLRLEADFLRPYRWAIGLGLLGLLVQSVLLLPVPLLQGWVVDKLVALATASNGAAAGLATAAPLADRTAIAWAIGLALGGTVALLLARSFISWWTAATMGRISQEVIVAMRGTLHRKLMRLPMAYFDRQQTGRIMARVTSDVGSIFMFIRSGIIQLISDLILSVAIAIVLVWLQWRLAIVALVAVPLYAVNQRFFFAHLRKLSDEIRAEVSALYALLSERVSAVRVVRSFVKEEAELAILDERIDRHRALSWANTRAATTLGALATMISGLGTLFVISYGVVLIGQGTISVGACWRSTPWSVSSTRRSSGSPSSRRPQSLPRSRLNGSTKSWTSLNRSATARTPGRCQIREGSSNSATSISPTAGQYGQPKNVRKRLDKPAAMEPDSSQVPGPGSCAA